MDLVKELQELEEEDYKAFTEKLVPNVEKERILGIRIPILRKLAGKLKGSKEEVEFLSSLPHYYLDENNLHALMISNIGDTEETLERIDEFLPFVDNWETSDIMNPGSLKKDLEATRKYAYKWLEGNSIYQRRYGITTFMKLFLSEEVFEPKAMKIISEIRDDDYYVKMAAAWYWSEGMVKNPQKALEYLENGNLEPWIRRKAIQKALESYRVEDSLKEILRKTRKTI